MRSYTDDQPTFLYPEQFASPIFIPHCRKDKWENEISEIQFPDIRFDMVHHNKNQTAARQNATIYARPDTFVKFSSFYPENDNASHTVTITTKVGNFETWWGDGDCGGITIPDAYKASSNYEEFIKPTLSDIRNGGRYEDNEVLFLMHVMGIIHGFEFEIPAYLNKETWEPMKQALIAKRNKR